MSKEKQKPRSPRGVPKAPLQLELGRMRRHPGTGAEGGRVTVNGPPSRRKPQCGRQRRRAFLLATP